MYGRGGSRDKEQTTCTRIYLREKHQVGRMKQFAGGFLVGTATDRVKGSFRARVESRLGLDSRYESYVWPSSGLTHGW